MTDGDSHIGKTELKNPTGARRPAPARGGGPLIMEQSLSQSRALKAEVLRYCRDSRLTPRESDIVGILADGIVRIKDIAERLKLSPNTVNNHVNSIFMKTKTRSKSEMLTILLNRIATELRWARLMRASPSILYVGDRIELVRELLQCQLRVHHVAAGAPLAALTEHPSDFLVYDLHDLAEWEELLPQIKTVSRSQVIFLADDMDDDVRARLMHVGAVDGLERAVHAEQLALLILEHLIEEESECRDFIETEHEAQIIATPVPLKRSSGVWGTGGIFVSQPDVTRLFGRDLARGEWVEFPIDCENGRLSLLRGRIAWKRAETFAADVSSAASRPDRAAGVGIRILGRAGWSELLTPTSPLSYIPQGPEPTSFA